MQMAAPQHTDLVRAAQNGNLDFFIHWIRSVESLPSSDRAHEASKLSQQDTDEQTPLHYICRYNHWEILRHLRGMFDLNLSAENRAGNKPLHVAAEHGHVQVTRQLLKSNGADVNVRNRMHYTPLHLASTEGFEEIVAELLLHDSVDVNQADSEGNTALHKAAQHRQPQVLKHLLGHRHIELLPGKATASPTLLAIHSGHPDVITALLSHFKPHLHSPDDSRAKEFHHSDPDKCTFCRLQATFYGQFGNNTLLKNMVLWSSMEDAAAMLLDTCVTCRPGHAAAFTVDYKYLGRASSSDCTDPASKRHSVDLESYCTRAPSQADERISTLQDIFSKNRLQLATHPVVLSYIHRKWSFLLRFLLFYCLLEIALPCLLTVHLNASYSQHHACRILNAATMCNDNEPCGLLNDPTLTSMCHGKHTPWSCSQVCSAVGSSLGAHQPEKEKPRARVLFATMIPVLVLCCVLVFKELLELYAKLRRARQERKSKCVAVCEYALDFENMLQLFGYVSAIAVVVPWTASCTAIKCQSQLELGAFSALATWLSLLFFLRKVFPGGIFVTMFMEIFTTYLRFLLFLVLFIVAFSIPFVLLFREIYNFTVNDAFSSFGSTSIKISPMASGDVSVEDNLLGKELSVSFIAAALLVSLFLFIIVMILNNLLNGIAFDNVQTMRNKASLKKLTLMVEMLEEWERGLQSVTCLSCLQSAYDRFVRVNQTVEIVRNEDSESRVFLLSLVQRLFSLFYTTFDCCAVGEDTSTSKDDGVPADRGQIESLRRSLCACMGLLQEQPSQFDQQVTEMREAIRNIEKELESFRKASSMRVGCQSAE